MKKNLVILIILFSFVILSPDAYCAKKSKGLKKAELEELKLNIESLTKKVYASSLFSPEDNSQLIGIKLKLDTAIFAAATPELAPLYYKTGLLYKKREFKNESIECFQTILENYLDTSFAAKSEKELKKMGVKIQKIEENEE